VCPKKPAFASDRNSADRFNGTAALKMSPQKPLKIPLFPMASGRDEVDELLGISIEQLTKQVPFRHTPHRHDFYHLFWVESGNGIFVSDGRSYPLTRGSLIFVPPGQVHAWKPNDTLNGYVLCFEPASLFGGNDRPYRLLHDLGQFSATTKDRATFQIAGSTYQILRAAFKDLSNESSGSAEFRSDMLRSQVTALLIRLHRLCLSTTSAEVQGYSTQLNSRFLLLLQKEEGKLQRTSFYTSALSVSPRVLVAAVLAETGITKRLDSGSNFVGGSAFANLYRLDDFRNRLSAKLSKRILLRTLLSMVGGCSARNLARSASVKISSESDRLSAFFRTLRV
jgi:quercetin dioxygenase-like cupin family protein